MRRNGSGMRAGAAAAVAGLLLLLVSAPAWASESPRPRVVFDRQGGFVVQQGEEASVTATLEGGSGGMWFQWEGNNAGVAAGDGGATFVIDTSVPGDYWLRAVGGSDGTDGDFVGKIRFRVVGDGAAFPRRAGRGIQSGETVVWSEDFSALSANNGQAMGTYNGWSGDKCYGVLQNIRIGSGSGAGYVISTNATLGGSTGRLEFSMWYHDSAAVTTLERSTDGGTTWVALTNYSGLSSSAQTYSVNVPASGTVAFKWSNAAKSQRFYLDDVVLYAEPSLSDEPPVLDLAPEDTAVEITLGDSYEIEVTATDYDGDDITLSASGLPASDTWEAEAGAGSATGYFIWTPTATGTWNVVFSATDKDGTTSQAVTFTVVPEGPGTLAFDSAAMNARESGGSVTLTVERTGGSVGAVTVAWSTANGTATAGSDYTAGSGTLAFAAGETAKTLSVTLLDDLDSENNETFTVTLGATTGGASLGSPSACTVTIVDDDDANADYYASCYKNGVLKTGDTLKDALCKIINPAGVTTNSYGSNLDTILKVIDACPTNRNQVQCIYLQHGISSFNKEHIWAQSHGIDGNAPGYSDLHHIRASDSTMNNKRGNLDFDNCQGKSGAVEYNGCYYISNKAWEPPDSAKGDVARAMLYMDVRYENKYNSKYDLELVDTIPTTTTGNQLGKLSTLLAWNELDPVDAFETNRNELIYTKYQGNRNPFIDHPDWARAVFDPDNYVPAVVVWTVSVTVEGDGWINNHDSAFTVEVTNSLTKTFLVTPNSAAYYHIGSISWNGTLVPQAYYTNASYYNYTTPSVTDNATLAVVFAADTAALGTPIWWLAEYGTSAASVTQENWNAAELEDWNDDGVANWEEYLAGNDPTAFRLRQVTGVTVGGETTDGFTVGWTAVANAEEYRVRVCSTAVVKAATAGFEGGEVDSGWTVSETGAAAVTAGAMDGTYGLRLSETGAWVCSPVVESPVAVEFKYKRSSSTSEWALAVEVCEEGSGYWQPVATVTDAAIAAQTAYVELPGWRGRRASVRLRDARPSGLTARYVDSVTVRTSGTMVAEGTTAATTLTATGLASGTGYDVYVRGEATTPEEAAGPWSEAVRATTAEVVDTRADQSISFPAIADQTVGATVELGATASSGLAVEYAVDGPATLSGTTLTCTGAGTVTVTASQAGNADWKPAESVTRTFEVAELVLNAPENAWASATNAAGFTAEWSAVAGATGYELEVWKDGTGEDGGTESETVLLSTNFASINGNGNMALNNGFIEGWTCSKAYGATNEIRVGASSALGWVKAPETVAAGTVRVVTRARAWSADANVVMWVGVTGSTSQANALSAESTVFVNDFENIAGAVTICWSNATASKQRFFLEEVSVTELSAGAGGGGGAVPVPGYDPLAVTGTSWAVTGLEAATAYGFHVRATAGTTEGGWSDAVGVTTLAADPELLPQSITFPEIGTQVATNSVALVATAGSGLAVSYTVAGPATLAGNVLTFTGAGTVSVTASQAGNDEWAPAEDVTRTFAVVKAAQSIDFPVLTSQSVGDTVALNAAANSGLTVSYTVSGPATLEDGVLTCTGAGTVTVTASQSGNDFYEAATPVERSFAVSLVPQTIDFATIGNQAATATVALSATASSGLEVGFIVTDGPAEVNGSTLTFTGAGEVTVMATQAGTTMYAPASASHTFTVVKASQTITFDAIAGQSVTDTVTLEATSSSGLDVSYTVSGPATLSGTSLSFTGAGTVTVTAHQPGNALWAAASDVVQEFAVSLLEQTIDFPEIAAQVATNTVVLSATASSGLEVTFEVTSGPAVLNGTTLTFTGAGEVSVMASQAGNESYESATASQTFAVAKATAEVTLAGLSQTYDGEAKAVTVATEPEGLAVVVTYDGAMEPPTVVGSYAVVATVEDARWAGNAEGTLVIGKAPQNIDFAVIDNQIATNMVPLSATADSGLEVTFEVTSGPAALDGNVLSFTGSGTVVVTAIQAGDESYEAAEASQTFSVAKALAEVTLDGLSQTYDGEAKAVTVMTDPEGLAVVVTYDGAMEAPTSVGSYAVSATVEDAIWAGSAEGTLVIGKASQSIEFAAIGDQITTNTVVLSATASSGLGVSFEVTSGPVVLDGNVLSFTGSGTVVVKATQAGDESYEAAEASQTFSVAKALAEVTLDGLSQTYDGEAKAVTVMTDPEGLAVVVTYDGAMEAPTSVGSYAVSATVDDTMWAGNADGTLVIGKASQNIVFATIGDQITTNTVVLSATASSGLEVAFEVTSGLATLDGNVLSFTGSGTVVVTASQAGNESYEAATASQTFTVAKALAEVTLDGLSQTYDGEAKEVTVTTGPEGLAVVVTYDGNVEPPSAVGSYAVRAMVDDARWAGSAAGTLVIGKASQSIEFAAIGDQIATNTVPLSATASSGLEVTFEVTSGPASLDGNVLSFTGVGKVTVTATQAGNESYEAVTASQTFMVVEPEPEKSAYETWLEGLGLDVAGYPESSELDGDADGMSNWAEYVADTNPSNKTEFLSISVGAMDGGTLTLVPSQVSTNRVYSVVYWTNMLASPQTNVLGSGFDSLLIVTNVPATWFGTIRVGLP